MSKAFHPITGALALLTILTFWVSTLVSEVFGSPTTVVAVKTFIPWGFLLLVPALMATGGSGFALARQRSDRLVDVKRRRMPVIAMNGLLILMPAALFLAFKVQAGELDAVFYAVQVLELVAGAVNIALLGLNMRDGLRVTGRLRHAPA
ncbi:hypothetical protein [Thiocystis violascens]|uniref:Transmembrane protein n=1 Tax=Thiocystis violascens (strain ATCC 17096 / DSM 198 / 6111) TaxID=765911 RepID=I3Y9F9_THIV6|nr:hypothetical protein [Thiocystis violascens]AFL73627.1 hypothetical protein Thivi_1647 [Thiocystis violascens DSM 198]